MDIKLFSLCNQESVSAQNGKNCILKCVRSFFPDCEDFSQFSSQKRMILAISQSLRAADIVIVAVQGNMHNATKRLLSAAFDISLATDKDVSSGLSGNLESGKIKQSLYDANIRFPSGSVIFETSDFINCGFALSAGGQHVIYLPIDEERAQQVVYGSLFDYLGDLVDEYTKDAAMSLRHSELISRTVKKLTDESISVAIADINGIDFILANTEEKDSLKSCFIFENKYNDRNDDTIRQYIATTACNVKDSNKANLGVVISNAYSDDNSDVFMYIAIADYKGTKTIKVFAQDGETAKDLTSVCVDKLMILLYDYNEYGDLPSTVIEEENDKHLKKQLALIATGLISASAVVGLVLSFIMN